jgi:hypothetical protein
MPNSVANCFSELLDRLALTSAQAAAASNHAMGIRDFFDNNFTMAERVFTIGSYRRSTIVRPERDIDLMAVLAYPANKTLWDGGSRKYLTHIRNKLNNDYSRTDVSARQVAAVIKFTDIEAEVVPAFRRDGGGFLIPDGKDGWQATNPPYHTTLIEDSDKAHGGRLRPLVRLIKYWNLVNAGHLRSFHLELIVREMWNGLQIPSANAAAVKSTLGVMASWIKPQREDPWPSGGRIDSYLKSDVRQTAMNIAEDDAKASAQAEDYRVAGNIAKAVERWQVVYRHEFPALA